MQAEFFSSVATLILFVYVPKELYQIPLNGIANTDETLWST